MLNKRWKAINGSVYVETKEEKDAMKTSVAFNVGEKVAQHIAELHNQTLEVK
jgi:hypothetical protein